MPTPDGQILTAILQYLAAKHVMAFRMNTLAMPTPDGKRFIKAGVKGMADILAFPQIKKRSLGERTGEDYATITRTIPLWIEVKAAKGTQSEFQKSFQRKVEDEDHLYIIARGIEDVERYL